VKVAPGDAGDALEAGPTADALGAAWEAGAVEEHAATTAAIASKPEAALNQIFRAVTTIPRDSRLLRNHEPLGPTRVGRRVGRNRFPGYRGA